ncbi:MAG: rod-binding protein [Treponema sp.]|nr:rod-binding protein [Treponema sp.]
MEISGFGLINMDDYRPSSPSSFRGAQNQNFQDLFERIKSSDLKGGQRTVGKDIDKNDKLYELCLELETFLVKNLLNSMRSTVQKSGLVDDSFAGKMYEDMLYDEYAKDFTRNANFGLAEQAYRQLRLL